MSESEILLILDLAVRQGAAMSALRTITIRVADALKNQPESTLTWEPVPLKTYGADLPPEVKSSWIFVLRSGLGNAERHPNSRQRVMSFDQAGDLQIYSSDQWVSNFGGYF